MDFRLQSPYCNTYKIPNQQKGEKNLILLVFVKERFLNLINSKNSGKIRFNSLLHVLMN